MTVPKPPCKAVEIPATARKSNYPEPFASRMEGRTKRRLGDHFGLVNFGVNQTELAPGGASALLHQHSRQDEFIYILEGTPTLRYGDQEVQLEPGDCMGFACAADLPHQLLNRTAQRVVYLEVGDRSAGDQVVYPEDDIRAEMGPEGWVFSHKDGSPYL